MQRRNFCKAFAAGIAGTIGVGALAGGAAAQSYPGTVTTVGHFETSWGDVDQRAGDDDWETDGTVPGVTTTESPDELAIFVHGLKTTKDDDRQSTFDGAATALERNGYEHPMVGYAWDDVDSVLEWSAADEIARRNGPKLAAFVDHFASENPGATVRVLGHSLGARVVLEALRQFDESNWDGRVASATLLGAAVPADAPGSYEDAISGQADRLDNYHNDGDSTLQYGYGAAAWEQALGLEGADGSTPANYADHDVGYVDGHSDYYRADVGCVDEAVDDW